MNLELLFWLMILMLPLLSQLLGKRKAKQQERQQTAPAERQKLQRRPEQPKPHYEEEDPLEEALRQIREALGGEPEPPPPPPPRQRPEPVHAEMPKLPPRPPRPPKDDAFREMPETEQRDREFLERPVSRMPDKRATVSRDKAPIQPVAGGPAPIGTEGLASIALDKEAVLPETSINPVAMRLLTAEGFREAFIMKEILAQPRAKERLSRK